MDVQWAAAAQYSVCFDHAVFIYFDVILETEGARQIKKIHSDFNYLHPGSVLGGSRSELSKPEESRSFLMVFAVLLFNVLILLVNKHALDQLTTYWRGNS